MKIRWIPWLAIFISLSLAVAQDKSGAGAASQPDNSGIAEAQPGTLQPISTPPPTYPKAAEKLGTRGTVVVQLTLSAKGTVDKVDVLAGDPMLADGVVSAVKQWKYKPYQAGGKAVPVKTRVSFNFKGPVNSPDFTFNDGAFQDAKGGTALPKIAPGDVPAYVVRTVPPVYPAAQRQEHMQGAVVVLAVVNKDGKVVSVIPVSGPEGLRDAAAASVWQWTFKPYKVNGKPANVQAEITVNFTLAG